MNPKIAIIVGVFALIMVLFGSNPMDDAIEQEAAEKKALYGEDPLMAAINEHNAKGVFGNLGSPGAPMYRSPGGVDVNAVPTGYPGYPTGAVDRSVAVPAYRPPTGGAAPNADSYYPPPPLSDSYNQAPQGANGPRSSLTLPDGRPVMFMGTRVYTLDKKGNRVPVPDGVYAMLDGRINMYVKDGRKISTMQ